MHGVTELWLSLSWCVCSAWGSCYVRSLTVTGSLLVITHVVMSVVVLCTTELSLAYALLTCFSGIQRKPTCLLKQFHLNSHKLWITMNTNYLIIINYLSTFLPWWNQDKKTLASVCVFRMVVQGKIKDTGLCCRHSWSTNQGCRHPMLYLGQLQDGRFSKGQKHGEYPGSRLEFETVLVPMSSCHSWVPFQQ